MAVFSYKAYQVNGDKVEGLVEAVTLQGAAGLLHKQGLFIITVKPHRQYFSPQAITLKFSRVNQNSVVDFTRQLATMVHVGLPLTDSISILHQQTDNPSLKRIIGEILHQVEGGMSLTKAIESYPNVFLPTYVSLVRAGEAAGKLDDILMQLAENLEKSREFKSSIKGAFIYPTIILVAMVIVIAVMMIFVIPKLVTIYEDFDIKLPLPTRVLMAVSDFSVRFWWLAIILLVVTFLLLIRLGKTTAGRKLIDTIRLKLPIFGPLTKKAIFTEFARTLSILISAGVPVLEALAIVAGAMDNIFYSQAVRQIATRVERGSPLAEPIRENRLFPPIMVQMVAVGEETGRLDETLARLASYFELEVEHTIKGLTTALEPIILIFFGIGVAFLVWSILSPIYQLMGQFY